MRIHGQTFLVTGGSSGLGAACVRQFVELGGNVVIADVQDDAGSRLADELGPQCRFVLVDITQEADVSQALDVAAREFGALDGVINCAGIVGAARVVGRDGPHPLDLFARVVQVNLVGTFNVIRLAAAMMACNQPNVEGERGVIINTASAAAFDGQIGQAAYAASKGGVAAMTLPIARELARLGIRVMTIAPGLFNTPMMAGMPPATKESLAEQVPFPSRLGRPEEYAALARHIVENVMLNGEVIRLDGALRMAAK